MLNAVATITLLLFTQTPSLEPEHARNPVYQQLLTQGFEIEGKSIRLPEPVLRDGQSADEQQALLQRIAGSEQSAAELLRDSVTAPIILKVRDEKAGHDLVRMADLWFVVHADLDALDSSQVGERSTEQSAEAGNMRFQGRIIPATELRVRKIEAAKGERFVHVSARLLDRIEIDSTDRVYATRSADSVVFASLTERRLDDDSVYPNRWSKLIRQDGKETAGEPHPFAGGASWVKISRLRTAPKTLLVEGHFAFLEPFAWFDGAPILRSKFGPVAQERVRRLRRELATKAKS